MGRASMRSGDEIELANRSTVVVDRLADEGDWVWLATVVVSSLRASR
jgi:hypothetical protein